MPCTLIDSANPMVIVDGKMFGLNGQESPEEIDQNKKLQEVLEIIRTKVTVKSLLWLCVNEKL